MILSNIYFLFCLGKILTTSNIQKNHNPLRILIFCSALFHSSSSIPVNPGQPGGEWTSEEIDIVRDKVKKLILFFEKISWN